MNRFFYTIRPWLFVLYMVVAIAAFAFWTIYLIQQLATGGATHAPLFFVNGLVFLNFLLFFWILRRSQKPFVDEKSPYRLWERGVESVGLVTIALPPVQVHAIVLGVLQENPKLRVHRQTPEWIWVSLGKHSDQLGYWLAGYFVPGPEGTVLTLGIWSRRGGGYDVGRNRRTVTRLFDAIAARIAPLEMVAGTYQHNALTPVGDVASAQRLAK